MNFDKKNKRIFIACSILVAMLLQLNTVALGSSAVFTFHQSIGNEWSVDVKLGDLNGDGFIDAFVANRGSPHVWELIEQWNPDTVWFNDGTGTFYDSGQHLGFSDSHRVALADIDNDQDLDAVVAVDFADGGDYSGISKSNRVWVNDGVGYFSEGQWLGDKQTYGVSLGDLNDDGFPDAYFANWGNVADEIWFNELGIFIDSGQALPCYWSFMGAMGDLDGDNDIDIYCARGGDNRIFFNDGSGFFIDSGQSLGTARSEDVNLGDVDDDGDLDAFVANVNNPNIIWFNDGSGYFTTYLTIGSTENTRGVVMGDLDRDGDLDGVVTNDYGIKNQLWLNDGSGNFSDSGLDLGTNWASEKVGLGDLDLDNDLDIFITNSTNNQPNGVFFNDTPVLNSPPIVNAGGPYFVNEGDNITLYATGSDPEGDEIEYVWDLNNDGHFETFGESAIFSASLLDGPSHHTVSVKATDPGGCSATDQTSVEVYNLPTIIKSITGPLDPIDINSQPVILQVIFMDPGINDTHEVYWDWGDEKVDMQTHVSSPAENSHIYTETGVYKVQVTIIDDDGGIDSDNYEFIVIYNPSGGFVTGGGWIWSPEGAYQDEPALVGKANFGFVSKYKKGENIPSGQTQFQFKNASLNFNSTNYQWLVVNQNGTNAQYKGEGLINGELAPNGLPYYFIIWAMDLGEVLDTIRIKIWYEENGENVIYDNGFGQPINGGKIQIHTN